MVHSISDVGDLEQAVRHHEMPRVDVFTLVTVIGKGDYCIGFRAYSYNPTRPSYALLFPREPRHNARIKNKAHILEGLNGGMKVHTTQFISHGHYRGMPFLAESYAHPLSRIIALDNISGVRPNLDDFVWFFNDLLAAQDYFHSQGYVHGDLHPGNIAISDEMKVKLLDIDFAASGVAPSAGLASGRHASDGYGIISGDGTRQYLFAAPEVCDGAQPTPSSDIYSVGAVCFALLAGRPPQRGEYDICAERQDLPGWTSSLLASMIQRNTRRPSAFMVQRWLHEYQQHDKLMGRT